MNNNNSSGEKNTFIGVGALLINKTGFENTAPGFKSLFNNTQLDVKRFDADCGIEPFATQASYNEAAAIRKTGFIAEKEEKAATESDIMSAASTKQKVQRNITI